MTQSVERPPSATSTVAAAILGSDPDLVQTALATISFEGLAHVYLVGDRKPLDGIAKEHGHTWVATVHDLISEIDANITHVWMLHDDARPRRGALAALLDESLRNDASLAGSKVLSEGAELESVGGSTDVLLTPYSGLTPGEIDQGQYEVVRDVAFIPGASVLIRRDLLRGLDGPDPYLAPDSQAIDLAQRARVAGGRVIVVPSSEVFHDSVCRNRVPAWREQAGRYRAILKVYSLITVIWAAPFALLVGLFDAFVRLIMGETRPVLDFGFSVAWNVKNAASTVAGRRKMRRIRQVGDEELFLYQTRGSLAITNLGSDVTDWLRERTGEGSAFSGWVENRRGFWQEVGFVAAVAAVVTVAIASRTIWSDALPTTGYALPLLDARNGLASFAGGWNPSSLGTPASVHPTVGVVAALQWLLGGRGPLVMTLITLGSLALGYTGTIRLLRHVGLGATGRAVGAWSVVLGPVGFVLADLGYWPGAVAAGLCPWAVFLALDAFPRGWRARLGRVGFGVLLVGAMSMFVPFAVVIPLAVSVTWGIVGSRASGHSRRRMQWLRAAGFGVAAAGIMSPWLVWGTWDDFLFDGSALRWEPSLLVAGLFVGALLATLLVGADRLVEVAGVGGILTFAGLWLARSEVVGIGLEPSAAGFVLAGVGVAMVLGAAGDLPSSLSESKLRVGSWMVAAAAIAVIAIPAFGSILDGRLGYGPDRFGATMTFTEARAEAHGPDRVLFLGSDLPGGSRLLDGVSYRVGSAPTPQLSEGWLTDQREGDAALEEVLIRLLAEGGLRPGAELAPFGIRWVVSTEDNVIEQAFIARLDIAKLPIFDLPFTVYENLESSPRAISGTAWTYAPEGSVWYVGSGSDEVKIAESPGPGWPGELTPGFGVVAEATEGAVAYGADPLRRNLGWFALAIAVGAATLALGSLRRRQP